MYKHHYFKSLITCLLCISANEPLCLEFIKYIIALKRGEAWEFNFTEAIKDR